MQGLWLFKYSSLESFVLHLPSEREKTAKKSQSIFLFGLFLKDIIAFIFKLPSAKLLFSQFSHQQCYLHSTVPLYTFILTFCFSILSTCSGCLLLQNLVGVKTTNTKLFLSCLHCLYSLSVTWHKSWAFIIFYLTLYRRPLSAHSSFFRADSLARLCRSLHDGPLGDSSAPHRPWKLLHGCPVRVYFKITSTLLHGYRGNVWLISQIFDQGSHTVE